MRIVRSASPARHPAGDCAGSLVAIGIALIPMMSSVPVNTFMFSPIGSALKTV